MIGKLVSYRVCFPQLLYLIRGGDSSAVRRCLLWKHGIPEFRSLARISGLGM